MHYKVEDTVDVDLIVQIGGRGGAERLQSVLPTQRESDIYIYIIFVLHLILILEEGRVIILLY